MKTKRDIYVRFRVTAFERELIRHRAEETDLRVSDFCRNSIFNKRINYAFTDKEEKIYSNLIKFNNDFERLANHFKNKDDILVNEVRQVAYELKKEIRYIRSLRNGRKSNER